MHPFEYVEVESIEEAVALMSAQPGDARLIAGGTDLLSEIKEGVVTPHQMVGLSGIPELWAITETDDGLSIGSMTTIAAVAAHPVVRASYAALAEAAAGLATPQIRNVGTLGGNLCQRPRCWYYRHPLTNCLKKGGDRCFALAGNSKYLCVTGGERCYIVHPSDTAVALTALDAALEIAGPTGLRTVSIEQFFLSPDQDVTRENILAPGELVTRVYLPKPLPSVPLPVREGRSPDQGEGGELPFFRGKGLRRSLYLKAREREAGDFALVSVAAVVTLEDSTISRVAVVLGGVAPTPYRAKRTEDYLRDRAIAEVDPALAGSLALPDAKPMADNHYKVVLAANLVKRALNQSLSIRAKGS